MTKPWMIYGANGYSAQLTAHLAKSRGHTPILAGRDQAKLKSLGATLGLETRCFALSDPRAVALGLEGISAVLNCAGPFSKTAMAMLDGCIKTQTHYLDITGEIDVFEAIFARSGECQKAGIVALPGVGFDVVPTDCLAAMLKAKLPDASTLTLAFMPRGGSSSPGTAKTMIESLGVGGRVRRAGKLEVVPWGFKTRDIPFPGGAKTALLAPWGDVSTAFYTTGIPNIEVYIGLPTAQLRAAKFLCYGRPVFALPAVVKFLQNRIGKSVQGPDGESRSQAITVLWGEVLNPQGQRFSLGLTTPEGYSLTADAAVKALERLFSLTATPVPAGAWTPAGAFGADFLKELEGVEILS